MAQTQQEKNTSDIEELRREVSDLKNQLARTIIALRKGMSQMPNIEPRN
jgi:hypothetical protein